MGIKYLFGDSEPFPGKTDFLALLRSFVKNAGRAALLHSEIDAMERSVEAQAQSHERDAASVSAFFDDLTRMLEARIENADNRGLVEPYAREIIEYTTRLGEATKARVSGTLDEEKARVSREVAAKSAEVRQCLDAFFVAEPLPVESWAFSMHQGGDGGSATAIFTNPGGIETAYEMARDPHWSYPRRVADFAQGVTITIGMKKKFLRSSMVPETVLVDDWLIGSIELSEEIAEIGLRRKGEMEDTFVYRVETDPAGSIHAEILKAAGTEGGDQPHPAEMEDVPRLSSLADAIRRVADPVHATRRRLLWVKLHEQDVLENDLLILLLDRIIDQLAPIAAEVSRRSPNANELSLKLEHDDGRREEIYLKKDDVFRPIKDLPDHIKSMFARLGIVPRTSLPAPPGAPGTPRTLPPPPGAHS